VKLPSLTVAFITARDEPRFEWFVSSLEPQANDEKIKTVVVSVKKPLGWGWAMTQPKPTVWQGQHRLTKEDNWAVSNARNTAICLCETEWIAFLDDRCVLGPQWLEAVHDAMRGRYVVCGPYEKTHNLVVENGAAKSWDKIPGRDARMTYTDWHLRPTAHKNPWPALPEWTYGCSLALPLEWALAVNGFDETCDGLSGEDGIFGWMLHNRGYPILFDERLSVIQDRTPGQCGPVMIRRDKGVSPHDASHALLAKLGKLDRAAHPIDLRQIRKDVLAGKDWPKPWGPTHHFFDNQPLSEM